MDLYPQIRSFFIKKYNVLLWQKNSTNNLYSELEQFRNHYFLPNERIVYEYNGLDFFQSYDSAAESLHNLYQWHHEFDLPTEHTIVVNFQHNLDQESHVLAKKFSIAPIRSLSTYYFSSLTPGKNIAVNANSIDQLFVLQNCSKRKHSLYNLLLFEKADLLDQGVIIKNSVHDHEQKYNDFLIMNNKQSDFFYENLSIGFRDFAHDYSSVAQKALWSIVNENVGDYPRPYILSIFDAILQKRPFMLLSSQGSLQELKKLGFRTFDKWINEDYDNCSRFVQRSQLIVDQLKSHACLSINQMQEMCVEMNEILEFNFDHYNLMFNDKSVAKFLVSALRQL
jgi:hypothetical protein